MLRYNRILVKARRLSLSLSSSAAATGKKSVESASSLPSRPAPPAAAPSTTTTIQLHRLPLSVTESSLQKDLLEVKSRKVQLEPGCAIHVLNEAEADFAAEQISAKLNCDCSIASATIPSLLLQNMPDTITAQTLEAAFSSFRPKSVHVMGGASLQVM